MNEMPVIEAWRIYYTRKFRSKLDPLAGSNAVAGMRKSHLPTASKGSNAAGVREGGGGTPTRSSKRKEKESIAVVRRTPSSSPKITHATAKLHVRAQSGTGW